MDKITHDEIWEWPFWYDTVNRENIKAFMKVELENSFTSGIIDL